MLLTKMDEMRTDNIFRISGYSADQLIRISDRILRLPTRLTED